MKKQLLFILSLFVFIGVIKAQEDVLILGSDNSASPAILNYLNASNDFDSILFINIGVSTPSFEVLLEFDVLFIYSNQLIEDQDSLGNMVVDFINEGKSVVYSPASNINGSVWGLAGDFSSVALYKDSEGPVINIQSNIDSGHDIFNQVDSVYVESSTNNGILDNGGEVIGTFDDGITPSVIVKEFDSSRLVFTNVFPVNGTNDDGFRLIANSIKWAASTNLYSCPDNINYCPAIAGFSGFEWNQEVTFNGMTATTGNNGGYISYVEDETKQVNVAPNGVVNLNLTPGFSFWAYHVGWKVFVDWNQNGDFDDAGELVYSGFSNSAQSGQFTVPVDVEEGCYPMRIANAWGAYPSTGCSNVTYGEIEDYKLSVEGVQPPQARKASPVITDVDHISYDFEFAADQVLISQGKEIDITLRSRNSGNSQFDISNSIGQIVSSINVNHQEGIGSIQFSTTDLSKGIYFIGNSKTVNAVKVIVK
jgi:hypothetical protein